MKEVEPISGLNELNENRDADVDAAVGVGFDPFAPQNAPGLSLIVLMRIYDVMLAQFREENPEGAKRLRELHAQGKILGPLPSIDLDEADAAQQP